MSEVIFKIRDFSDEYSTARFPVTPILADGTNYADVLAEIDNLQTALAAVTSGHIAQRTIVAERTLENDTRPPLPWAQREIKWLIRYQDTVSMKKYTLTLPCAALELMTDGGDDQPDITGITAWSTMVTWLEANMVSPEGNPINVNSVSVVGRNI